MRIVIHYLESIEGVAIFPIIGIFIFFSFFLGLLYYVYHLDRGFVDDMANSPLGNDDEKNDEININQ
jgi:cytochrome c oxidase cbb3-type subunit 3